jgi:hypothetical protein
LCAGDLPERILDVLLHQLCRDHRRLRFPLLPRLRQQALSEGWTVQAGQRQALLRLAERRRVGVLRRFHGLLDARDLRPYPSGLQAL